MTKDEIFAFMNANKDAYLATLFKLKPFGIAHIKIAHDMKIGIGDLKKVNVVHLKTA